jgi:hypothetical protein
MKSETVWGIIGSGFGLYGYMPAIADQSSREIYTLARYQSIISSRADIKKYADRIVYEKNVGDVLDKCNGMVIALRPQDQELLVAEILNKKWSGKLILEKPIARTPAKSHELLMQLFQSGINYRIGFTLGVTAWSKRLKEYLIQHSKEETMIQIEWRFLAHHYKNQLDTWKRYPIHGGGASRFYAIHIISLLANLGIDHPVSFQQMFTLAGDEPKCRFSVAGSNVKADVTCDSSWIGDPFFSIAKQSSDGSCQFISLSNPFTEDSTIDSMLQDVSHDVRVVYLCKIVESLYQENFDVKSYLNHIQLWGSLEEITQAWL